MKKLFCLLFLAPLYINAHPLDPLAEDSEINTTPILSYARYEQLNAFLKEKLAEVNSNNEQSIPLFYHMIRALRLSTGLIEEEDKSGQIGWRIKKKDHTEKAAHIQAMIAQKSTELVQKEAEKQTAIQENEQKNQSREIQKQKYITMHDQAVANLNTKLEKDIQEKTATLEKKKADFAKAFETTKKTNADNTDMLKAVTQTHTKQLRTLQETHEADLAALKKETTESIAELTENKDAELQRQEAEKTTQASTLEAQLNAIDTEISTLTAERDRLTALKPFWEGYYKNPDHGLNFQQTASWASWADQATAGLAKAVTSNTDPFYWAIPLAPKRKATTVAAPGAEDDDDEDSSSSLTPEQLEQEQIKHEVFALLDSGKVMLFPFQSLLKENPSFFMDEKNQDEGQILNAIKENMDNLAKIANNLKKKDIKGKKKK